MHRYFAQSISSLEFVWTQLLAPLCCTWINQNNKSMNLSAKIVGLSHFRENK